MVGSMIGNLAQLEDLRRRDAEPLYLRAVAIQEKALGAEHPELIVVLNNLAEYYRKQARFGEAEPVFLRAIEIGRKRLPTNHWELESCLSRYSQLLAQTHRKKEGRRLAAEVKRDLANDPSRFKVDIHALSETK